MPNIPIITRAMRKYLTARGIGILYGTIYYILGVKNVLSMIHCLEYVTVLCPDSRDN